MFEKIIMEALHYLKYAPQFLFDLSKIIIGPKTFIRTVDLHSPNELGKSFFFLVGSTIFILVSYPFAPKRQTLTEFFSLSAGVYIFWTVVCSLAVWTGWKCVGARPTGSSILTISFYIGGASLFLQMVWVTVVSSMLYGFNPDLYDKVVHAGLQWQVLNIATLTQSERYISYGFNVVFWLFVILVLSWYFIAWGAYREAISASRVRSSFALLVTIFLLVLCMGAVFIVGMAINQYAWREG
jgi:hypothetical protein